MLSFWLRGQAVEQRNIAEKNFLDFRKSTLFRELSHEIGAIPNSNRVAEITDEFQDLDLNPLMALHLDAANGFGEVSIQELFPVSNGVSLLKVSEDGNSMLITYDYQAPNGSPEREGVLGDTAGLLVRLPDGCLLYTSPSPRDKRQSRMPSSA